jgi:hypothetical protein
MPFDQIAIPLLGAAAAWLSQEPGHLAPLGLHLRDRGHAVLALRELAGRAVGHVRHQRDLRLRLAERIMGTLAALHALHALKAINRLLQSIGTPSLWRRGHSKEVAQR